MIKRVGGGGGKEEEGDGGSEISVNEIMHRTILYGRKKKYWTSWLNTGY